MNDVNEKHIEKWPPEHIFPRVAGVGWWAVCDRCDDDAGPYPPVALFQSKADADKYIEVKDIAGQPLAFDACVLPAVFLPDGTLAVSNSYDVETHDELLAALRAC